MLILTSLFFLGCSRVSVTTTLFSNGKISTYFEIDLTSVPENRGTIYQIFKEYYNQLDKKYEETLIDKFKQVYGEPFASSDHLTQMQYIIKNNPSYACWEEEFYPKNYSGSERVFYLTKEFASIYAYLMYFCPSAFTYNEEANKIQISKDYHSLVDVPMASNNGDIEESGNIFVKKYIQDFCPFYYDDKEPEFLYDSAFLMVEKGEKLKDVIMEKCGYTEEQVEYVFNFTTPYKRLHSSGSTQISSSGYTHTWNLGSVSSKVEVWRNYANYTPWYTFAAVVSIVGLVVSFVVLKIINKTKRKKGLEILEKINDFQNLKK